MANKPEDLATRVLDWGTIKWLVSPDIDEGASLTAGEVIVYPGQGHAEHRHADADEVIYVISGIGVQTVGDSEPFDVVAGDAIYVPRDTLHSTFNTGWSPLRIFVVYTPGGAEKVVDELPDARVLPAGEAPMWSQQIP